MISLQTGSNSRKNNKKTLRDHMCEKGIHTLGPRISVTMRKKKSTIMTLSEEYRNEFARDWKLQETKGNDQIFVKRFESKRRCKNCRQLIIVHHKEEHDKVRKKTAEKLQKNSM